MEFIGKIPNWLRYILAIPFGIIFTLFAFIIVLISKLLYSDPNSLYAIITTYIFANGISVILFFYGYNIMLPKRRFAFTITLASIIFLAYSFLMIFSITNYTMKLDYALAYLLFTVSTIISCYFSYKKRFDTTEENIQN